MFFLRKEFLITADYLYRSKQERDGDSGQLKNSSFLLSLALSTYWSLFHKPFCLLLYSLFIHSLPNSYLFLYSPVQIQKQYGLINSPHCHQLSGENVSIGYIGVGKQSPADSLSGYSHKSQLSTVSLSSGPGAVPHLLEGDVGCTLWQTCSAESS